MKVDFNNINKVIKDFEEQIAEVDFKASLEKLNLEDKLKKLQMELEKLGGAAILAKKALELTALKDEYHRLMKEANALASSLPAQKTDWIPRGGGPGGQRRAIDEANKRRRMQEELDKKRKANEEARVKIQKRIEALQKEYNDTLSRTSSLQSQIKQTQEEMQRKQEQLAQLNWKFFNELSKIANATSRVGESFAMGYKNGRFQDLANDIKYQKDNDRIGVLNSYLKKIGDSTNLNALESARTYLTEIFSLTKDRFKYEIDQLMMQRDAMINNLRAMAEIVKQAAGFRSSAQSTVEANSMEALELTSRRLESLRGAELSPMIEQQKQVKEIERQVLAKQNQAVQVLERINTNIYNVVNKIGSGSGANTQVIPVNPL